MAIAYLAIYHFIKQQWGFLLLESVWTLVSAHSLWMRARRAA